MSSPVSLSITLTSSFGRDDGGVSNGQISADALHRHHGLVGHYHVQKNKVDPGPAFDWDRLLRQARALIR